MDDLSAGVVAGAISGVIFPIMLFISSGGFGIDLQGFASRETTILATRGLNLSLQTVILFMVIGFLFLSFASAGVGAILGLIFVKFVNRLPVPSIYFKALGLSLFLYLLASLPRLVLGRPLDIYIFAAIVAESVLFGFLFVRWTRRPMTRRVPKSNSQRHVS